jgi:hypothetical protein
MGSEFVQDLFIMCIITGSQAGSKVVFHAYLCKYCADFGQIWQKYTSVAGCSSNGVLGGGGHASFKYVLIN